MLQTKFFSLCGLEVGLPAFQLPMFSKYDAVLEVQGIHVFVEIEASTYYQKLEVPESGSTLQQVCTVLVLCL